MKCVPKKFTPADLVNAWKDSSLKVNEDYQRGAKWKQAQKQGLIDSMFREYPIPPLFLHEIKSAGLGGHESTRYEIVDGQQRIRALADYFHGDFALLDRNDRGLRLPNSLRLLPAAWGKRRYSDLAAEDRTFLEKREIDVFVITEVKHADEVRDLFIRLQSGTALSRQQIRDAWPGNMGPYVEKLAGKLHKAPAIKLFQLVDKRGTRPEDDQDRYEADRQFCAQLICLFLARENDRGAIQGVGANELDRLYHEETEFNTNGPDAARFNEILLHTTKVFEAAIGAAVSSNADAASRKPKNKRKYKKLEVISVFLLAQDMSRSKHRKIEKKFYHDVARHVASIGDNAAPGKSTSGAAIKKCYENWRDSLREDIGIQLDPRRLFSEEQKAQIFQHDGGICQLCGKAVEPGDDEYDHFPDPYTLGGRTEVDTGRLVHKGCHPRGRPMSDDALETLGPKERREAREVLNKFEKLSPEDRETILEQLRNAVDKPTG